MKCSIQYSILSEPQNNFSRYVFACWTIPLVFYLKSFTHSYFTSILCFQDQKNAHNHQVAVTTSATDLRVNSPSVVLSNVAKYLVLTNLFSGPVPQVSVYGSSGSSSKIENGKSVQVWNSSRRSESLIIRVTLAIFNVESYYRKECFNTVRTF